LSFPSPSATVPTLAAYQFSYNGVTIGPGAGLELQKIEGLDQPDVRTGDAGRARDTGDFIGLDLLQGRTITLTGQLASTTGNTLTQNWTALAGATLPGGTTEEPLFFNLPQFGTLVSMCRVRKRSMPIDIPFAFGGLANAVLQFQASDPRLYATPTQSSTVGLPTPNAGFGFPLSFNFAFGGGGTVGVLSLTNYGNIETRPLLVITGPCTTPTVTNNSIAGSPYLSFGVTMNTGDQLIIDTDMHTATYFTAGSSLGSSRMSTLQTGSSWWTMQPGVSSIAFSSQDAVSVAGTLTVEFASAYVL
jgi:hypothetical protein